jgi:RNA polymerase sigma-70 factor, ECF subfamily
MMKNPPTIQINEDAWANYRKQLYYFVLKRVKDHFAAEDITQDILIRVYSRLDSLNSQEKFLPWLYQIARNAIADYYRRSSSNTELSESLLSLEEEDSESVYAQLAPCIQGLIKQLPPRYQSAIHYSEIDNVSQKELAQKIGISLSGAKSRVQRGRRLLKEKLLQCCQMHLNHAGKLLDFQSKPECTNCK